MSGVNKAIILGRLGKDPEMRYLPDGTAIASFSVATSETWKDKGSGEKKEKTEWHNVIAFKKLAEICGQYLSKGKLVYIEGRIQTRSWDDKSSGSKRYSTEIIVAELQLLDKAESSGGTRPSGNYDKGGKGGRSGGNEHQRGLDDYPPGPVEDDIPF